VYNIYWDQSTAGQLPFRDTTTNSQYTVTKLLSGIEYAFQVSLGICQDAPRTAVKFCTTTYDETAPPRDVYISGIDIASLTVSWLSPRDAPHVLTYKVVYWETKTGTRKNLMVGPTDGNHINQTITDLVPGMEYTIGISTVKANAQQRKVNGTTRLVPAPEDFHAVVEKNDHIFLSWSPSPHPYNESLGYTVFQAPIRIMAKNDLSADGSDGSFVSNCDDLSKQNYQLPKATDYKPILNTTHHIAQIDPPYDNRAYLLRVSTGAYRGIFGVMSNYGCVDSPDTGPKPTPSGNTSQKTWIAAVVAAVSLAILLAIALGYFVVRHRRLQRSFMSFANSHYDPQSGTATFTAGDNDLGDDEDQPMIRGFSDDEPLVVA
jgi:hypothetical protein